MFTLLNIIDFTLVLLGKYFQQDPTPFNVIHLDRKNAWLDGFDDDPIHCSERKLDAVQQCWISEM